MIFNARWLALAPLASTLVNGLPLEGALKPNNIVPRGVKSYAVVNVDGGSSTPAPQPPKTTVMETKTIEITNPKPTETTTESSSLAPSSTSSKVSPSTTALITSQAPTETPTPTVVTVVITERPSSTPEYYDTGKWHTYYEVKSFGPAVVTSTCSTFVASSSTTFATLPTLEPSRQSYNQTKGQRRA